MSPAYDFTSAVGCCHNAKYHYRSKIWDQEAVLVSMFNSRKARPEDFASLLGALRPDELVTPQEIVKRSGMTLTAVRGAIDELEAAKKIKVVRQTTTPKLRVGLID